MARCHLGLTQVPYYPLTWRCCARLVKRADHVICANRTQKDLKTLSELGHFLKGSSATLGLVKVRDGCEKIQRYGKNENLDGSSEPDSELCLKRIAEALVTVKADYQDVEGKLKAYYGKDDEA